ncbi:unnamed protein product, partial [marine sediment metagenome]
MRLMGRHWLEKGMKEANNNMVAISAHITAGARMLLWNLIKRLPLGNVLYCDTDSIIFRKRDISAFADVISDTQLGMLAIEKESPDIE